jgi:hypothetical protein
MVETIPFLNADALIERNHELLAVAEVARQLSKSLTRQTQITKQRVGRRRSNDGIGALGEGGTA